MRVDRAPVFEALPSAYVVLTPQLRIADMNHAYLEVTGRTREELLGRHFLSAFPPPPESVGPDGRSELQVSLERVRDTGLADVLPVQKYPIADADGVMSERHWAAVHVPVLDDLGRVRFVVQRTEDITEFSLERERVAALAANGANDRWRARAERVEADLYVRARELADAVAAKDLAALRVARLTRAALALAAATSLEEIESIVVGSEIPMLGADGGGLVTPDAQGGWRLTTSRALGEQVQTTYREAPHDSMIPGCWSARTGQRLLLPTKEAGLAFDAESMSGIYAVTARVGWAFVPLIVGTRTLGALSVSWVDEHELDAAELELLDGFALQCAQALQRVEIEQDNRAAALEVSKLAHSLQQALLTPAPKPDDLHLVVRYRPAGHHAQVGGDWYDAFLQPDGATMIVIGDVVGHDSAAAAKMGQLRGVLRTLAFDTERPGPPDTPATILSRLEHVTRGLAVDTMATTVLARLEPPDETRGGRRVLRWSNAGHPPPVLMHANGTVEFLDARSDLMLGVDSDAPRVDHATELPEGSTLLFYTDGLVERRDAAAQVSNEALRGMLADLAERDVDDLCDALLDKLSPHGGEDDIALIAVRTLPVPREVGARVDLPFTLDAPALARRFVKAHTSGLPANRRDDAELLVSELVTNAVRYGRPGVSMKVRRTDRVLRVAVTDHGSDLPVEPGGRPDHSSASGRGLLIVAALADDWRLLRDADGRAKSVEFEIRNDDPSAVA